MFPLKGLAGDFLNCIETSIILEKPDDYAWFPMTYGDEYESISKITNDALLTVSAFGSNQVKFAKWFRNYIVTKMEHYSK